MRFAIVFVACLGFYLATLRYARGVLRWLDDNSYGKRLAGVFVVGVLCVLLYIGVPALVFSLTGDGLIPAPRRIAAVDVLRNLPTTALTVGLAAIGIRLTHDGGLWLLTAIAARQRPR